MEVIWERPEPDERRASTPLARAQVVAAAVRLADADGLSGVSIRNVAGALGVRPMRLYSHVSGKDDLLELMIDAVYTEIARDVGIDADRADVGVDADRAGVGRAAGAGDAAWPARVRAIVHATRRAVRRHPWAIDLLGGRPHLSPHALDVAEATATALAEAPGRDTPQALRVAVGALSAFLLGALRREIGERRAGEASGLDTAQWQRALGPYLARQLATGRLPMVESMVRAPDPDADETFESELALILHGLARPPNA